MRVLVSKDVTIEGVACYPKITEVPWDKVDYLIFHNSSTDEINTVFALANLPKTVHTRIYINKQVDPLYCPFFRGSNSYIYELETYLENLESFEYMLSKVGHLGTESKVPTEDIDRLNNSIKRITTADSDSLKKLVNNKNWICALNSLLVDIDGSCTLMDRTNGSMVKFFKILKDHVNTLSSTQQQNAMELNKLKAQIDEMADKHRPLSFYGNYKVPLTAKRVLYVQCVGDVQYLMTFLEAYRAYLQNMSANMHTKILLIRATSPVWTRRYSDWYKILPNTASFLSDNTNKSKFITHEPIQVVLNAFFGLSADLYIVVDYLQGIEPLLKGSTVNYFKAYSSKGMYAQDRLDNKATNVDLAHSIFQCDGPEGAIVLKQIKGFSDMKDPTEKLSAHYQTMQALYTSITNMIMRK